MAQTIIIKKGDELLQDVVCNQPDTQVNYNCPDKYPVNVIHNGACNEKLFTDASGIQFLSPIPERAPVDDSGE